MQAKNNNESFLSRTKGIVLFIDTVEEEKKATIGKKRQTTIDLFFFFVLLIRRRKKGVGTSKKEKNTHTEYSSIDITFSSILLVDWQDGFTGDYVCRIDR